MKQRKENARNAEIMQKAKLSKDPTDIILALVKTKMRGSIKQKNEAVHHEITSFFNSKILFNIDC